MRRQVRELVLRLAGENAAAPTDNIDVRRKRVLGGIVNEYHHAA